MSKPDNTLPREWEYVDARLLNNEPPPGCTLPVVTCEGERWELSEEWVAFDARAPKLPLMDRKLALLALDPFACAARLREALVPAGPVWRPSPTECVQIDGFLRARIVAEQLRLDHAAYRLRDGEAAALWVHLFGRAPGFSFRISAVKRRALNRVRWGFSTATTIPQ